MKVSWTQPLSVAVCTLCMAAPLLAQEGRGYKEMTPEGCFSSAGPLELTKTDDKYQTDGACQVTCADLKKPVMAMSASAECWCGDLLPPEEDKVDEEECDWPCPGFPGHKCGGDGRWTVLLSGTKPKVAHASASSSTAASTSTLTSPAAVVTIVEGQTSTIVASLSAESGSSVGAVSQSPKSSGASTAGIAAGVVVGVVIIGALVGGGILYLRRRKRRELEEEFQRTADIKKFVAGGKDSASSIADSRLEPTVMMQRRQSDISIADNQDYSRRILKVTNPDGT